MPGLDPLAPFIEPLERLGLPYCITGSVAASVYGEPRLTADIDVVLLMKRSDLALLLNAFPESEYYVPPEETLRCELARRVRLASSRRRYLIGGYVKRVTNPRLWKFCVSWSSSCNVMSGPWGRSETSADDKKVLER